MSTQQDARWSQLPLDISTPRDQFNWRRENAHRAQE